MANYNVLTLSEPVTDFVATTSPETINVQCSLTEDAQRKRVWAVCKAGGVPAHPYDGVRVLMTGDSLVTAMISGLVNDTEYGVRLFVEGKFGYQTALEGATAAATPRAGQYLGDMPTETVINLPYTDAGYFQGVLITMDHAGFPADSVTLWGTAVYEKISTTYSNLVDTLNTALDAFSDRLACADKIMPTTSRWSSYVTADRTFRAFLLSSTEIAANWSSSDPVNGTLIDYFSGDASAAKAKRVRGQTYYTRNLGPTSTSGKYYSCVVTSDGGAVLNGGQFGSTSTSNWIVPALNLPKSTLVKTEPNADGSYDLL